jgi:hypothetical protein
MEPAPAPTVAPRTASAGPSDYRKLLDSSTDYWALAQTMLSRAKEGDAQAQYMLWRISEAACVNGKFRGYVEAAPGVARTRDETALEVRKAVASVNPPDEAAVLRFWDRCHQFIDGAHARAAFGDPWVWLRQASDSGEPLAQINTGNVKLWKAIDQAQVRAGADPTILKRERNQAPMGDGEPRQLMRAALEAKSTDPEVLQMMGDVQPFLNPTVPKGQAREIRMAWWYLACQHGRDCSDEWGQNVALPCAPNAADCKTVPARMLQQVNNDWAPVAHRIEEIQTALNNQQWDQLPGLK